MTTEKDLSQRLYFIGKVSDKFCLRYLRQRKMWGGCYDGVIEENLVTSGLYIWLFHPQSSWFNPELPNRSLNSKD